MKYLGIFVDNTLSWDTQCDKLCSRLRHFVKTNTLKLLYDKTIQPIIDYACSVWCHTKAANISKLQRVQNYAARIITYNFDYINSRGITLIRTLRWTTVKERCDYFTAIMMFKAIHGLTPVYLSDAVVMASETHDRDTRLSKSQDANVPSHNSEVLKRSFVYNGSVIWNDLPLELKTASDLNSFKEN